jgi:hypothetical protein
MNLTLVTSKLLEEHNRKELPESMLE